MQEKAKKLLSVVLCALMIMPSLTGIFPLPVTAANIEGSVQPKVEYSASGMTVSNPETGTDLDNFQFSLQYGTTGEPLGDVLSVTDSTAHVGYTVNVKYTGSETYEPGEISFTLQDICGIVRKDCSDELCAVDVGAELKGSGSGRGDWFYEVSAGDNDVTKNYVFTNKNTISTAFSSSVEMICSLPEVEGQRGGYSQEITSVLTVKDLGTLNVQPLTFTANTTPHTYQMNEFTWEPYAYNSYGIGDETTYEFHGYKLSDYYIEHVYLDFDEFNNSRGFGDFEEKVTTDHYQEGSFGRLSIEGPEGIRVINPAGEDKNSIYLKSTYKDFNFDSIYRDTEWREWFVLVPRTEYPDGTEIPITAKIDGKYFDTFQEFNSSVTQNVRVLPTVVDVTGDLFHPYKNYEPSRTDDPKLNQFFLNNGGVSVEWILREYAPVKDIGVTKSVITDEKVEWTDILKNEAYDVSTDEYSLQSIAFYSFGAYDDSSIKIYVKRAGEDYQLVDTISSTNSEEGDWKKFNISEYNAQHFKVEIDGKYAGQINVEAHANLDPDKPAPFEERYIHNVANLHVESPSLANGEADMLFNCTVPDQAYYFLVNPNAYLSADIYNVSSTARVVNESNVTYTTYVRNDTGTYTNLYGNDVGKSMKTYKTTTKLIYPTYLDIDLSKTKLSTGWFDNAKDVDYYVPFEELPEWVTLDIDTKNNNDDTKTTTFVLKTDADHPMIVNDQNNSATFLSGVKFNLPVDVYSTLREKGILPTEIPVRDEFIVDAKNDTTYASINWEYQDEISNGIYKSVDTLNLDTTAIAGNTFQGIDCFVKGDADTTYTKNTTAEAGQPYKYKFRISGGETQLENVVIYSNLEEAFGTNKHWKGTFNGIDTSILELCGANPVVYYSTSETQELSLSDPGWTKADDYSGELANVKSIAIDLGDYKILPKTSAFINVNMLAPSKNAPTKAYCAYAADYKARDTKTNMVMEDVKALPSDIVKVSMPIETTSVYVEKVWDDDNNRDAVRPESVEVKLLTDNEEVESVTLGGSNPWNHTFENLPISDGEHDIVYTVDETNVPKYSKKIEGNMADGFTITNAHTPERITISGTKTWDDDNNRDNLRPESITVNLLANGEKIDSKTITANDNWEYSFNGLYKRKNGNLISYSITEDAVEHYETTINGFNITNKHTPDTVGTSVQKVWDDDNNRDNLRPNSISVQLYADNEACGSPVTLQAPDWSYKWTGLNKKNNGQTIDYTVREVDTPSGYDANITGNATDGFVITNKHIPERITISGTKTWNDNNNQDGIRPDAITIRLKNVTSELANIIVTALDNWSYKFENLYKYENGQEINYSIAEDAVNGYQATIDGYNVTNTHNNETINIPVTKVWEDNNNQDGGRPDEVNVQLYANDEPSGDPVVIKEEDDWKYTFKNLPKYANGTEIEYTVKEEGNDLDWKGSADYYTSAVTGNMADGFTITNTHEPLKTRFHITKQWADNNNQDGIRPETITIRMWEDNKEIGSFTISGDSTAETWYGISNEIEVYRNGSRRHVTFTEDTIDGYTSKFDAPWSDFYIFTNTHKPGTTNVTVNKVWDDKDNQDNVRPELVSITLIGNDDPIDTIELKADDNWTHTWENLPEYENGKEIEYRVVENDVPETYTASVEESQENVFTVTNKHDVELTSVSGTKTWDDNNNEDNLRPENITVRLLKNGEEIANKVVSEKDEWKYTFDNLEKNVAGKEAIYTVTEDSVKDYTTKIDGFDITNTHTPERTSITVTKKWNDDNNRDGIRPDKVQVQLLADGEPVKDKTVTLNEKNKWTYTFSNLPVYSEQKAIKYTVEETKIPTGYEAKVSGSAEKGFIITNTHEYEKTDIKGSKTWDDNNNSDKIRPNEIKVNLYADGEKIATATATEKSGWKYSFLNAPVYSKDGKKVKYTITEDAVAGYKATIKGFDITNKHIPEKATDEKTDTITKDDDTKTGDTSRTLFYFITLWITAGIAITTLLLQKKKKKA